MYSRPVPHLSRRREGVFITLVADRGPRREGRPELRGERGAFHNFRAPAFDEASLGRRLHDLHADVARCIAEVDGPQFDVAALLGDAPGDVCVEIVAPPPQGRLVDGWGAEVKEGAALATKLRPPFAAGAPVRYESDEDAFTAPNQRWNGSAIHAPSIQIKYRAFACDAPSRTSPVATQSLEVINVNDAPTLLYPARAFAVYAGVAESDDEFPSTVRLAGLELTDADRDVDAVRVTVSAKYSTSMLSMDAALLPLADFNSDRDCFGRGAGGWRCEGDGLDDARFTFVAPPSAANRLLQTLSYRSVATDVRDVVSVEVFDGVGGECLHQHNTASIRDGCFRRNASLTIYVASYALFEQHAAARDRDERRRQHRAQQQHARRTKPAKAE